MKAIRVELRQKEQQYVQNKSSVLGDDVFLREWLELLELYPKFGQKANTDKINFLKRQLNS
jgi:hypothetical protein